MANLPYRRWQELTTEDFARLDPDRTVAVLPVAAIEQHGPHLPLMVDACINEGLVDATIARLPDALPVLFLPAQSVGWSEEHAAFAGTLSIAPETLLRGWLDIGGHVARSGVRKLVLFNSHGGQTDLMRIAIRRLRIRHRMLAVAVSWFSLAEIDALFDAEEIRHGIHGGAVETSLMLHLRPDLVRGKQVRNFESAALAIAKQHRHVTPTGKTPYGWATQDLHPSGAVGNARKADAEKGRIIVEQVADRFVELLAEVVSFDLAHLAEAGPLPGDH